MKHAEAAKLMGQVVLVEAEYERSFESAMGKKQRRSWEPRIQKKPRPGWVVGFRYLQAGYIARGDWESPNEWIGDTAIPSLLVSYWPTLQPVRVPLDSFKITNAVEPYSGNLPWAKMDRISYSEAMEGWPRDAKGRWKAFKDFTPEENQTHTARQNELARQRVVAAQVAREILEAGGEHAEWLMREGKRKELSGAYVIMSMGDPRKERH